MKIQDNLKFILATRRQKQKGIRAATGRFTKQRDRKHRSRLRKSLDNEQATQFLPLTHHLNTKTNNPLKESKVLNVTFVSSE